MVQNRNDEEREKLSWREIDRRKDRSRYAPKEPSEERPRSQRSEWIMKKYKKEADKIFMGRKGTKKHQKIHHDIERFHGTEQFEPTAKTYLDEYGLPEDWGTLSLLLDYSDPEKVSQVLQAMKDIYPTRSPVEKQAFKSKVDILGMTASDSELREVAEDILKAL